jgi:hypothetical protein
MYDLRMSYGNLNYESNRVHRSKFSKHAAARSQQRGISQVAVPLIKAYGEQEFDGNGGVRYLLTSRSVAKLERLLGHSQHLDALAGAYVVASAENGHIITLGHRRP